ncbi:MAG: hypothetical protein JXR18_13180 [Neptuniibacter sp.]
MLDFFRRLFEERKTEKDLIDSSANVCKLRSKQSPKFYEAQYIDDLVKTYLTDGIPASEEDFLLGSIVYLHFDRIYFMYPDYRQDLLNAVVEEGLSARVLKELESLHESAPTFFGDSFSEFRSSSDPCNAFANTYLLLKELERRLKSVAPIAVRDAIKTSKKYRHQMNSRIKSGSTGHYYIMCWKENEIPPIDAGNAERKTRVSYNILQRATEFFDSERKAKTIAFDKRKREADPLYDNRPQDYLQVSDPDQEESVEYWSLKLYRILANKYQNRSDYQSVALKIGEKLTKILLSKPDANSVAEAYRWNGVPRLLRLYNRLGLYEEGVALCDAAILTKLPNPSSVTYQKHLDNFQKKLKPAKRKPTRKGALTEEQKVELVKRYVVATADERKLLAIEYGVTKSNLSYIVSKNRHRVDGAGVVRLSLEQKKSITREYLAAKSERRKQLAAKYGMKTGSLRQLVSQTRKKLED